jgi:hypothetical protein
VFNITTSLVILGASLQTECDVTWIKYVVSCPTGGLHMRYFGVFNVRDVERETRPSVVVVTDDDGLVTDYYGSDEYWLLAKAVAEKANIRDVVYGPSQFVLAEIDAPVSAEVNAYLDNWANNAGLRHLVGGLAREEPYLEGDTNWVTFLSDDAYIEASVKLGITPPVIFLSIDAYLLSTNETTATEQDVEAWVARQPKPELGMLSVGSRQREDGETEFSPLLSLDCHLDSILARFVKDLIAPFAEAWDTREVAVLPDEGLGGGDWDGGVYRYRPGEGIPRNAWLLMGDEASYPTPEGLRQQRDRAEAGIFDYDWTAPKNGELGDLVLVYFIAPRKSACFIARLATAPHWQTDIEVNALNAVDVHQWWSQLTPLIEIDPIPYKTLQEATGGYLPLRGRSGHYLPPRTIQALTFTAKDAERQAELDRVVQVPSGNPDLPEEVESLDEWKAIPAGALPLEAKVSEHIVRPLARLAGNAVSGPGLYFGITAEYRVPSGFVDFVFMYPASTPALAVEVKLTVLRPQSGVWTDSPDFQQLQRYMRDLDVSGLLVDAQRLLLVKRGSDAPFAEIIRSEATWEDIALVRDLILGDQTSTDVRFELASFPFMAEEPSPPFVILTVADHNPESIPTKIEVHPDADEKGAEAALQLIANFEQDPSSWATVNRLAVSYGWLRQISGPSPESSQREVERPRRRAWNRG